MARGDPLLRPGQPRLQPGCNYDPGTMALTASGYQKGRDRLAFWNVLGWSHLTLQSQMSEVTSRAPTCLPQRSQWVLQTPWGRCAGRKPSPAGYTWEAEQVPRLDREPCPGRATLSVAAGVLWAPAPRPTHRAKPHGDVTPLLPWRPPTGACLLKAEPHDGRLLPAWEKQRRAARQCV